MRVLEKGLEKEKRTDIRTGNSKRINYYIGDNYNRSTYLQKYLYTQYTGGETSKIPFISQNTNCGLRFLWDTKIPEPL